MNKTKKADEPPKPKITYI